MRVQLVLFGVIVLAGCFVRHRVEYDNTVSRYLLLSAIVDQGVLHIDAMHEATIDKSFHDGHYYSNKAIGSPLLAAPVYALLRAVPLTRGERPLTPLHRWAVTVATSVLPFALACVALWRLARAWGADPAWALWSVLALALGTIAWVHATLFSGHLAAASFAFLGFCLLNRVRRRGGGGGPWAALAGLSIGVAVLCDYTAIVPALVLAAYAAFALRSVSGRVGFLLGVLPTVAALLLYNQACFGSPFSLSYGHLAHGEFAAGSEQGLLGIGLPSPAALLALLVSPARGLLFMMPVCLFGVFGLIQLGRVRELRPELWVLASCVVGVLLLNAGFYGWHGGWTHGPRYLVPMLPFLFLAMAVSRAETGWFGAAAVASVAQVLPAVIIAPHVPEQVGNPIFELLVRLARQGYAADNGLSLLTGARGPLTVVPWLAALAAGSWLAFHMLGRQAGEASDGPAPATVVGRRVQGAVVCLVLLSIPPVLLHSKTDASILQTVVPRLVQRAERGGFDRTLDRLHRRGAGDRDDGNGAAGDGR